MSDPLGSPSRDRGSTDSQATIPVQIPSRRSTTSAAAAASSLSSPSNAHQQQQPTSISFAPDVLIEGSPVNRLVPLDDLPQPMTPERTGYGATGSSLRSQGQQQPAAGRAAAPGRIALPPSPWAQESTADSENAIDDASTDGHRTPQRGPGPSGGPKGRSQSIAAGTSSSISGVSGQQRDRALSFKRRAGSNAGQNRTGLLARASFGAFGAGGRFGGGQRGAPKWRKSFGANDSGISNPAQRLASGFRRAQTLSVHQQGGRPGESTALLGEDGPEEYYVREDKPRIPSLLPKEAPPYSSPIPTVPFLVLCLVCFGEFSSAGVAGPFLFFQIAGFDVGGEKEVGFWAGIVAAVFFFAQFLTSLLWASVAEKHGRRIVLLVSLLGNAATLVLFGMSTNLRMAICVRLAQGLFNGAVGVAKGAVRDLCDETNEGRAMGTLGFFWGMGGIVGPILGGLLEHPAQKYPKLFGGSQFLIDNPYVLPCMAAASFTLLGAFLTCFIGPNGGPREGAIALPEKVAADVERATTQAASNLGSFGRTAGKRLSGYFGGSGAGAGSGSTRNSVAVDNELSLDTTTGEGSSRALPLPRTFTQQVDEETGGPPSPIVSDDGTVITHGAGYRRSVAGDMSGFDPRRSSAYNERPRGYSRTRDRQRNVLGIGLGGGSAYGYDRSSRAGSAAPEGSGFRSASGFLSTGGARDRNNRTSFASANQYAPDFEGRLTSAEAAELQQQQPRLSFAQRFLLANDDAVLSITDLWVAAAAAGDEYIEDDEDDLFGYDYDEDEEALEDGDMSTSAAEESAVERGFGYGETPADEDGPGFEPRHLPPLHFAQRKMSRGANSEAEFSAGGRPRPRSARSPSWGRVPTLYANTGVDAPLLSPLLRPTSPVPSGGPLGSISDQQQRGGYGAGYDPTLAGIPESASNTLNAARAAKLAAGSGHLAVSPDGRGKRGASVSPGRPVSGLNQDAMSTINESQSHLNLSSQQQQQAPSMWALLPRVFIGHYGLMSFCSSTCDQIFMAFLVTPYLSGGLGLTAAHYAELIAAMAFCQILFQFHFYPKVGPPQGKWSHLSMLRLGEILSACAYILFPLLRYFLHPSTDALVMTAMVLFASVRWLANICQFTAASILMNATTPPHLVPMANGLAQTTSSAARFIGPIVGGFLFASYGAPGGFLVICCLSLTGFLHSLLIR